MGGCSGPTPELRTGKSANSGVKELENFWDLEVNFLLEINIFDISITQNFACGAFDRQCKYIFCRINSFCMTLCRRNFHNHIIFVELSKGGILSCFFKRAFGVIPSVI